MKNILYVAAFALAALATSCTSCRTNSAQGSEADSLTFTTVEWSDSAKFHQDLSALVEISCAIPAEYGTSLADSISMWLCQQMGDSTLTHISDLQTLVSSHGSAQLANFREEIESTIAEDSGWGGVEMSYDLKVEVIHADAEYVTLLYTLYEYLGGAHGSTIQCGATFRRSDGHRMGWDLIADLTKEQKVAAIKNGLMKYFEVDRMDHLPDCLMIEGDFEAEFPLPATEPYLTDEGVAILYQQYEIACYAAGMPTCILPLCTVE